MQDWMKNKLFCSVLVLFFSFIFIFIHLFSFIFFFFFLISILCFQNFNSFNLNVYNNNINNPNSYNKWKKNASRRIDLMYCTMKELLLGVREMEGEKDKLDNICLKCACACQCSVLCICMCTSNGFVYMCVYDCVGR